MATPELDAFRRAGSLALLAVASAGSFAFLLGMPWHGYGAWADQEMVASAVHGTAAAAAVILGLLVATGDRRAAGAVTSLPVVALALLGLVTLALAPFALEPWQSVYGTMKHGVGALWHLETAVLAAACAYLLAGKGGRFLLWTAAAAMALACAAYAFPRFGVPLAFHEWTGMGAGAAALAMMVRARKLASLQMAAGAALAAGGWLVSDNRAVLLAAVGVIAAHAAFSVPGLSRLAANRAARAGAVLFIALGGMMAAWAAAPLIESSRLSPVPAAAPGVVSSAPEDHVALMDGPLGTIWSRSYMVRIVFEKVRDNPAILLHGSGWSSFNEAYETHAREVPGRTFPQRLPTASRTYWDTHTKANFHSHNIAAEALLAGGLPGLVLWLGFLSALAASSRSGFLAGTAIAVVSTFWFPVSHMTVPLALLVASGTPLSVLSGRSRKALAAIAPLPTALFATSFAAACALTVSLAVLMKEEAAFPGVQADLDPATCRYMKAAFLPETEANIYLYRALANRIMGADDSYAAAFDRATNLGLMSCTMRAYAQGGSLAALIESLDARARLAGIGRGAWGILSGDLVAWGSDVDRLLEAAPGRTEYVIPYVLHLRERNPRLMAEEATRLAASIGAGDPAGLFLKSVLAEQQGRAGEARAYMREALSAGYANIVPTAQSLVDSVTPE